MIRRAISLTVICTLVVTVAGCSSSPDDSGDAEPARTNPASADTSDDLGTAPCDKNPGPGDAAPPGLVAGDLVEARDLTDDYQSSPGYPTNARVFRLLYVSTKHDESDLVLVCGLAAIPSDGPTIFDVNGNSAVRMITHNHGTIGVQQKCLPSSSPENFFWGPSPAGIGAVAYGTGLINNRGLPENGMLQYLMNQGWVVSASDYLPADTYIIGRVAAANVIDAARATQQLISDQFPQAQWQQTDVILTGHSQGGHATIWAGQLFETYLAATSEQHETSSPRSPIDQRPMRLLGVFAQAPASNFVIQPEKQRDIPLGNGLADWEMHQEYETIGLPIRALELEIGPALAGYIFASWSRFSENDRSRPQNPTAKTPAAPQTGSPLSLAAIATDQGSQTINEVIELCLSAADAAPMKKVVSPYVDAQTNQLLVPELWNLPADYKKGQYFKAGFDRTCATTEDPKKTDWCQWLRWNLPGPNGDNPYPKVPIFEGEPVPTLIGHGMNDTIIHCVNADSVPAAKDCMSVALFESLLPSYCPDGQPEHYLRLDLYQKRPVRSPATHLSLPGQMAARGTSWSKADLSFTGSSWQRFLTEAFDSNLPTGCQSAVVNAVESK